MAPFVFRAQASLFLAALLAEVVLADRRSAALVADRRSAALVAGHRFVAHSRRVLLSAIFFSGWPFFKARDSGLHSQYQRGIDKKFAWTLSFRAAFTQCNR